MKKLSLYVILVFILWILFYSFTSYNIKQQNKNAKISLSMQNFNNVKGYLEKNYKWNYPIPSWDLLLLDNHKKMIHLTDRNTPLGKVKKLFAIQWNTCDILKNNKQFNKINYDPRFSIKDKETWKIIYKKCFTYSITKDRKKFQIWTIVKNNEWDYVTRLDWSESKSITKSYDTPILVKNNSKDFLPYSDTEVSPIVKVSNLWNSKLLVKIYWEDFNLEINLKDWLNRLLSWDISWKYNISII